MEIEHRARGTWVDHADLGLLCLRASRDAGWASSGGDAPEAVAQGPRHSRARVDLLKTPFLLLPLMLRPSMEPFPAMMSVLTRQEFG
jgi:hypothetical protein